MRAFPCAVCGNLHFGDERSGDLHPFVLAPAVLDKLRFVHRLVLGPDREELPA